MLILYYTNMGDAKKILIAGGTGLVGSRLVELLNQKNYSVGILTRDPPKKETKISYHQWDLKTGYIDPAVTKYSILINLTGAGIADKPWTDDRKKIIIDSRINSISLLLKAFSKKKSKLSAVFNASAIGYYGNSGEQILDEESEPQSEEFLVEVCKKWEDAAHKMTNISKKLYLLRIGTVLSRDGGALPKMSMPVKFGAAAYLGDGKQWMSWIHIDDLCEIMLFLIENAKPSGIYNAVAPQSIRNKEFTKELKNRVNRFALLIPSPEIAVRLAMGDMANLVFNSNRISADKIINEGFEFQFPELPSALDNLYRKE
jgi:uncharacterized protein (TIGR01777 family)